MKFGLGGGSWFSRHRTLLASSTALLLLLALGGDPAAAKPRWVEKERSLTLTLNAPASNGYRLSVTTAGHRHVWATLEKGGVAVTYRTEGQVSRRGIKAEFGAYGAIDVKLRDARRRADSYLPAEIRKYLPLPRRNCRGRSPQRFAGRMVGTIELTGENGFARVDTGSAKGQVRRTYRRLCKKRTGRSAGADKDRGRGNTGSGLFKFSLLEGGGEVDGRKVHLLAMTMELPPELQRVVGYLGTGLAVTTEEEREGLLIRRSFFNFSEPEDVWINRRGNLPTRAKVTPGKPFAGTASLTQPKGGPVVWKSDLAVRLPGIPPVPLTAPGIKARICRYGGFDDLSRTCLPGRKSLLQLSGSHSQALADVRLSISR